MRSLNIMVNEIRKLQWAANAELNHETQNTLCEYE